MKMPCEIGKAGKPFTKRIVHRPRVEGAEPELHVRLRGQQLLQQLGERHLRLEVLAVGRDLDAGQHDLVHARVSQPRVCSSACSTGRERTRPLAYGMMQ